MVVGTKPGLEAVGSATVAVLSQSSGIAAIFAMRRVTWYRSAIIAAFTYCCTIIAPFTCCCTNSAVASTAVVRESSKREVCVLGTPSSLLPRVGVAQRGSVVVRVRIFVCLSVHFQNALAAANTQSRTRLMRQWSCGCRQEAPGRRLLAALLSQFSHNHPV